MAAPLPCRIFSVIFLELLGLEISHLAALRIAKKAFRFRQSPFRRLETSLSDCRIERSSFSIYYGWPVQISQTAAPALYAAPAPPDTETIVCQGLDYVPSDYPSGNQAFILISDLSPCHSVAALIVKLTYNVTNMLHSLSGFPFRSVGWRGLWV